VLDVPLASVTQLGLTRKSDAWSLIRCSKSSLHSMVSRKAKVAMRCEMKVKVGGDIEALFGGG
jgi:hypothetical protein